MTENEVIVTVLYGFVGLVTEVLGSIGLHDSWFSTTENSAAETKAARRFILGVLTFWAAWPLWGIWVFVRELRSSRLLETAKLSQLVIKAPPERSAGQLALAEKNDEAGGLSEVD